MAWARRPLRRPPGRQRCRPPTGRWSRRLRWERRRRPRGPRGPRGQRWWLRSQAPRPRARRPRGPRPRGRRPRARSLPGLCAPALSAAGASAGARRGPRLRAPRPMARLRWGRPSRRCPRRHRCGGGIVGDGNRRDALLGRLVARRRSPPAQAWSRPAGLRSIDQSLLWWIRSRESGTARAMLKPSVCTIKWSVVIDSAVRSFVRHVGLLALFSCPASWGRESLAHAFRAATIARPCPNRPI